MSPQTSGTLERVYLTPNPPCGRCEGCEFKPDCRTYSQRGTIVTLSLDRAKGQSQAAAELNTTVFNLLEVSIPTHTAVNQIVRRQIIPTVCLSNQTVRLQPYRRS